MVPEVPVGFGLSPRCSGFATMPSRRHNEAIGVTTPASAIRLEAGTEVIKRSHSAELDADWISVPESLEFPTGGGRTARTHSSTLPETLAYPGSE